jgi:omega-amidase
LDGILLKELVKTSIFYYLNLFIGGILVKNFKVSLIQCLITNNVEKMNQHIKKLIEKTIKENPDIIILPEKWRPIPDRDHFFSSMNDERGSDYILIKNLSREFSVPIISGGIWERRTNNNQEKYYITSYYFEENGEEVGRQDKLHLYSYEPSVFTPGNVLNIFEHKKTSIKFSILICFDVAFYETPRLSVEKGAEVLISPTLINQDGLDNWKIYLQARALENRIPVVACNPVGDFFGRHFPGNSKVISFQKGFESPSKLMVKELNLDSANILTENINISFPNRIRKKRLAEKIDMSTIKTEFLSKHK